jgi:hypothetical protein
MSVFNSRLSVSRTLDWIGRLVTGHTQTWIKFGDLETKLLVMDDTPIEKPVYICGLARSGSTILLETLAARPGVVTHRYQDFPFLFTPYWWNTLLKFAPWRGLFKRERAHGDRILISTKSPEAMEEMLWVAFFQGLHSGRPETLTTENSVFDKFYREHIQKLFLVRRGRRYVAKGNYNITRMSYLARLFPDARFIIPVREPVSHVVSLMRQHDRFLAAGKKSARVTRHLSQVGHFEFGLNRIPIHTGDEECFQDVQRAWAEGEEIRGWALYWDAIHRYIYQQLEAKPELRSRALIVPYEDLCANPRETLKTVFAHAELGISDTELALPASRFSAPDYYQSSLTEDDKALIREITGTTFALLQK